MNNLSGIYRLVRNFLFSSVNKEFLIFLFFLFLSGTFWLLMALNETYEYEYPVTPRLVGVPKNVVITGDIDDTIHVTIRDKGFTLVTYLTGRKFRPLSFKFTSYAKASGKGIIPHTDIVKQITAQLFGSSKLTKVTPDHMEFFFNYGRSKTVPIRMSGKVVTDNSYYLARTQFFPRQITIYANEHLLDSIKYVTTQPFYISHLGDTVVQEVGLKPIRGVKMVPGPLSRHSHRGKHRSAHQGHQHARWKNTAYFSRQGARAVHCGSQPIPQHKRQRLRSGGRLQ